MRILKVGLLFSASTLSKLLAGLVVVKIIAVYAGADGLGRLGQFMSLMSMITILAGGGVSTGVVKFVAQYRQEPHQLTGYIGAASLIGLVASVLLGTILLALAAPVSQWLFGAPGYAHVIRILAGAQFIIAATNLLMGLVNGHKRVNAFAVINGLGVIVGAAGVAAGCIFWGIEGAMYGLIWMPVANVLFLLPWYFFGLRFPWRALLPVWDRVKVGQLLPFSLMLLVSVLTMQMAQIVIRQIIEADNSWVEVGYWQAVSKISDAYLQFITVVLASYYLPRLAEKRQRSEIQKEVWSAYKIAMPVLVVMSLVIFLMREFIILLLFSPDFLPMKGFFPWQLTGDAFKIAAYIGAYVAVARASTRIYIVAEIFQAGTLVLFCYFFVGKFGAVGASYAYCATYVVYLIAVQVALRLYFRRGGSV